MADHRELVSTPIAEFVRDFGAVWVVEPLISPRPDPMMVRKPYGDAAIGEGFASTSRYMTQDRTIELVESGRSGHADEATARAIAVSDRRQMTEDAIRSCQARLAEIAERQKEKRRNIVGRLLNPHNPDYKGLDEDKAYFDAELRKYRDIIADLDAGKGVKAYPLPETITHYGRLELGTRIWGFSTGGGKDKPAVKPFLVGLEYAPDNLAGEQYAGEAARPQPMRYDIVFPGAASESHGPERISVELGADGLKNLSRYPGQFFLDRDQAVAARDAYHQERLAYWQELGFTDMADFRAKAEQAEARRDAAHSPKTFQIEARTKDGFDCGDTVTGWTAQEAMRTWCDKVFGSDADLALSRCDDNSLRIGIVRPGQDAAKILVDVPVEKLREALAQQTQKMADAGAEPTSGTG